MSGAFGAGLSLTPTEVANDRRIHMQPRWLNASVPIEAWRGLRADLRNHDAQRSWDRGFVDQ